MSKRRRVNTGNFICEWFGYRIYPKVTLADDMLTDILDSRCPFLSHIKGEPAQCVKRENRTVTETEADGVRRQVRLSRATGVCAINSSPEGSRRDWVACPYRILDRGVLEQCVRRLFRIDNSSPLLVLAAPTLAKETARARLAEEISLGRPVYVFFEQKMGGEISLPPTHGSPEMAFDLTFAEISGSESSFDVQRYGIVELQTSDFHGSPIHALSDLRSAAELYREDVAEFALELDKHPEWLSNRMEGPNISNIFKRTFYQMMFKFQLVEDEECVGCALIMPFAVWESWQRHLGKPELIHMDEDVSALLKPAAGATLKRTANVELATSMLDKPSWIYAVEPEAESLQSPNPLRIRQVILTNASSFSYYALERAPQIALSTSAKRIMPILRQKIRSYWPNFGNGQSAMFGT